MRVFSLLTIQEYIDGTDELTKRILDRKYEYVREGTFAYHDKDYDTYENGCMKHMLTDYKAHFQGVPLRQVMEEFWLFSNNFTRAWRSVDRERSGFVRSPEKALVLIEECRSGATEFQKRHLAHLSELIRSRTCTSSSSSGDPSPHRSDETRPNMCWAMSMRRICLNMFALSLT